MSETITVPKLVFEYDTNDLNDMFDLLDDHVLTYENENRKHGYQITRHEDRRYTIIITSQRNDHVIFHPCPRGQPLSKGIADVWEKFLEYKAGRRDFT
jgi:hypothetical protein